MGANIFRDMFAAIRDIVGGQAGAYEKVLTDARHGDQRDDERSSSARCQRLVGVDLDYEVLGDRGSMLMVSANGTAVVVE